ncbi:minor tail protein [Gordonia phage Lilbeanie]|uniref:Minor tail protein n=1 Tax=Gordonia phage Lilbeanie TaxID=2794947 RepID=A0A7T1KS90_9CAUD|nr:minor tail protein [Gordonia phage Lilbeanie]QPO17113.1 minor tail protein [Gordonia phage Lilbeanie]
MSTPTDWADRHIQITVPRTNVSVVDAPVAAGGHQLVVLPGPAGRGFEPAGYVDAYEDLPTLGPNDAGQSYIVGAEGLVYTWNGTAWPDEADGWTIKGSKGDDGRGIASIAADGSNFVVTYTDATTTAVAVPALAQAVAAAVAARVAAEAAATGAEEAESNAEANVTVAAGHALTASTRAGEAEAAAAAAAASAEEAEDIITSGIPNATDTVKGGIRLAGDLAGTWDAPEVPGLDSKVDTGDARLSDARRLRTVDLTTATAAGTAAKTVTGAAVVPSAGDFVRLTLTSGSSIGAPTLAVNGGTAYPIRVGNLSNPPSTAVSFTANGIMILYFDGAVYHLVNEPQPMSEISDAEITAGTATTPRLFSGRRAATVIATARSGVELAANKGQANGYPSLDAGGKVPISQLPSSIMEYKGVWNAATNTPALSNGTGDTGDVYRVTAAGTRDLGSGAIEFAVGDYAVYNAAGQWEKSDTTDAVTSVAGLIGVITAAALRTALGIDTIETNVAAKAAAARLISTGTGLSGGGDLTADRTLSVLYGTTAGTAAQGNDSRLSNTRTPTDNTVSTVKLVDGSVTVAKLAQEVIDGIQSMINSSLGAAQRITVNAQAGAYTLVLADANKAVEIDSATAVNLTVPADATVDFPIGTVIEVDQIGAGKVSIVGVSGVTVKPDVVVPTTRAQWSAVVLRKRAANYWVVTGDLV